MDKKYIQLSRTMAEQCTKERLIELYLDEVENGCEVENKLKLTQKALELACKELRDINCMTCNSCNRWEMCDYVLSTYPESYFIEEAKEMFENG